MNNLMDFLDFHALKRFERRGGVHKAARRSVCRVSLSHLAYSEGLGIIFCSGNISID